MKSRYPEIVADEVIEHLKISDPEDLQFLDQIAYARGAIIREHLLEGSEARLSYFRDRSIITLSSKISTPERRRFCICHELGHLEMHRGLFLCSEDDINDTDANQKEKTETQANQFASAFLLPSCFVGDIFREVAPTFETIRTIAKTYHTSLTATALRMTDFSTEPIAVVYSEGGKIKWFRPTEDFSNLGIFVNVRGLVDPNSSAGILFKGRLIDDSWREVHAEYWLREGNYRDDARIKESSIHMPNYDAVLTLLWIDEVIEKDDLFY